MTKPSSWRHLRSEWFILSYYQRFEGVVALVLTVVIALIILVALFRLTYGVITGLLLGVLDPLDHGDFQAVLGDILTLLIAQERCNGVLHRFNFLCCCIGRVIRTGGIGILQRLPRARQQVAERANRAA